MIVPRSYQIECVHSIWNYFSASKGNPVCALPTGTGKSIVIAMFLQSVYASFPNQKILVLTHVKELIEQNYNELRGLWPTAPAGINSSGLGRRDTRPQIIFAGIGSVVKTPELFGRVDLILVDECHLISPKDETMYQRFISDLMVVNPFLKIIGFTATPWRLGQGKITEDGIFTDVCFDITGIDAFHRLIAEGYLSPLIPKHTTTRLDVSGVHMRGGEFIASELQNAIDRDEITEAALKESLELAHDRNHWLIFTAGVEHAIHTAEILSSLGEPCIAIHSKMSSTERDNAILDFKSGKYRAVTNNNILTTGFNFPQIDHILMLRPTASPVLWVQMLGRGTRPVYAKGFDITQFEQRMESIRLGGKENCLVLDFAGNTRRLGPINDPVLPRKKGEKSGPAPVKLCPNCHVYNHASARHCVHCGLEFKFETKLKKDASTEELIKGEAPIVEVFDVSRITYSAHNKVGRPPSLKVTYFCGLQKFDEYICLEHEGPVKGKARSMWRQRCDIEPPETVTEALALISELKPVTHLRVWINKKYPEILAHCYDGTAFGTVEVSDSYEAPEVDEIEALSQDIPF